MKAYKLTDTDGKTKYKTQWGEGVSHTATGDETNLCSNGWIHFYTDPLLAVLINPIHANFKSFIMWECETAGEHRHEPLKSGCKTLTTLRQIPIPEITRIQKAAFGILCAKEVYEDKAWNKWADDWLNGVNRSIVASGIAADNAWSASYAPTYNYYAPDSAAGRSAAYEASCSAVYESINVTGYTGYNSAVTAHHAVAYDSSKTIDFVKIAKKAMTYR